MRLDSREAMLRGGESGPALVPGDARKSRIVERVSSKSVDTQMPPDSELSPAEIEILVRWIESGAPWPSRSIEREPMEERIETAQLSHWALQPINRPPVPRLDEPWIQTPVDQFVLRRLRSAGLEPSPAANKRTLIRRASFDLTGLPPTPLQVSDFLEDDSPHAWAKLVDRLLGSPEYGKRWGRHWLDVARYADTRGYSLGREPRLPFAYTYRDYVVRAFNHDKPYDRFIMEQLAADQLVLTDKRDLAAMGFLTVGRRYSRIHDTIDDRIDVVTRGLMGLTTVCARCHDHKFDPIPTKDYYSLYGVFASCTEPAELPLIEGQHDSPRHQRFFAELSKRQQRLDDFVQGKYDELLDHLRSRVTDYLVQLVSATQKVPAEAGISLGKDEIKPKALIRWWEYLKAPELASHPVMGPWTRFAKLNSTDFSRRAEEICKTLANQKSPRVNRLVREAFVKQPPRAMMQVARTYGQLLEGAYAEWKQAAEGDRVIPDETAELLQVLFGEATPTAIPRQGLRGYFDRETNNRQRELTREIEKWNATSPDAPPRAMVLADKDRPVEPVVFERGNPARRGEPVPRRFLRVLSSEQQTFQEGSGRAELARSVASRDNPLTARVLVNRVWLHHFGEGLVPTPSDFGIRTAPPSHPLLLDYLAWEFMDRGWSIKWLHREMLLSATYQQASRPRQGDLAADPENHLLWRMNRRRLEFESFRDSMLFVSGQLDRRLGGRPVEMWNAPYSRRSTIYGLIDRQHLAGELRVFDFASPDASTPKRTRTVVPQQALFAMNSRFVAEQARHVIRRDEIQSRKKPGARINFLYQLIYGRPPTDHERSVGKQFITAATQQRAAQSKQPPWEQYAQALLMANELMFVD